MKKLIKCGCGRVSRWKSMPGGKRHSTDIGTLEYRHCACGSTHSQIVDASQSARLKTRRGAKAKRRPKVVTAKDFTKRRMLNMMMPMRFR